MRITPENLPDMIAAAKKKDAREAIDRENADRTELYALLCGERPKTRKNAARLIGALACGRDAAALADALQNETTLFVIPSIVLALGSVGGETAKAAITAYEAPKPADETEAKHAEEIADAVLKARAALFPTLLKRYKLLSPCRLLAAAPEGFSDMLGTELTDLGYEPAVAPEGCYIVTEDWPALYRARCMTELLIPLGTDVPLRPESIAGTAAAYLSVPYRVELRDYTGDRAAFLRQICGACGGENNPAHYALELRIICRENGCALYLKPSYDETRRYAWRKRTISASMKPALGACLARYIQPHVANPRVLDPFCGSGTLLFCCEEAFPCATLLGVDISESAVLAARENARGGKSRARFVQKDVRRFEPREKADLIISNLPFGNRVGTHENNRRLYAEFLNRLPALMEADGCALLYTMEYRLLSECIRRDGRFELADTRRTEAGGLLPWVFLLCLKGGKHGNQRTQK